MPVEADREQLGAALRELEPDRVEAETTRGWRHSYSKRYPPLTLKRLKRLKLLKRLKRFKRFQTPFFQTPKIRDD